MLSVPETTLSGNLDINAQYHARIQELEDEIEHHRQYRANVKRILGAEGWKPTPTLVLLGLYTWSLDAKDQHLTEANAPIELKLTTQEIADRLGISKPTAQNVLAQLRANNLIERPHSHLLVDRDGNILNPRYTDPRRTDIHWETRSTIIFNPLPQDLPTPEDTAYAKNQRDKAAEERQYAKKGRELAAIAAEVHKAWCPSCKTQGNLSVVCLCGFDSQVGELIDTPSEKSDLIYLEPELPSEPQPELQTAQEEPLRGGDLRDVERNHTAELATHSTHNGFPALAAETEILYAEEKNNMVRSFNPEQGSNAHDAELLAGPEVEPLTDDQVIVWLLARLGEDPRLIRQVNWPTRKYTPVMGQPDVAAYLNGEPDHVYGCRLALPGGFTRVLAFDFDQTGHDIPLQAAQELATAGARPIYWERSNGGHLELYFEQPVVADLARTWAESVAPSLSASRECFPASGQEGRWKDCKHQGLSWPLLRLENRVVVSCPMHAFSPEGTWYSPGWLVEPGQTLIREALAYCVTPTVLLPADWPLASTTEPSPPPRLSGSSPALARKDRHSGKSLYDAAMAWWKANHTEADVFAGVEVRWQGEYFAVRDERTPSVRRDTDGYGEIMYTDFGTGKKLDLFEVYVGLRRLNKREEFKRVVDEYLIAHGKKPLKWKY